MSARVVTRKRTHAIASNRNEVQDSLGFLAGILPLVAQRVTAVGHRGSSASS